MTATVASPEPALSALLRIALVGNPNCGKTALFNRLTGSRQKVANYAGVTVERKEGHFTLPGGALVQVLDLPGAYSLKATSPDEAITRAICLGEYRGEAQPDLLVCVVDATNLRLHLRFALELAELGRPMVLAINQLDVARKRGITIDRAKLQAALGLPVVETIAIQRDGARSLIEQLGGTLPPPPPAPQADLHAQVNQLLTTAVTMPSATSKVDDALDRWLLHPVWGLAALMVLLFFMFQAVFSWAGPFMDALSNGVTALGTLLAGGLPDGVLKSLILDGVVAGVGGVLVFLPQILILFLFIICLEESGYLPRAAFLLDRLMLSAGLTGRSFIPLLSSFACAVPGIMATRSITDPRDRLATILVAPLMTCSARLPVYALLIGAFIPEHQVLGLFNLQGLVLFALYVAGIVAALLVAYAMKLMRRDSQEYALLLELPSYHLPDPRNVLIGLWERAWIFIKRVGTIILSLTVILWFLSSFPAPPEGFTGAAIDYSFAGRIGHWLEVIFRPLGFNWQICIALVPGLAAREVAVSSLATVYALSSAADTDQAANDLIPIISSGWSLATAMSLLMWYVFAPMCISTLAVIKREANGWRMVWVSAGYLFALAYAASFIAYQVTLALSS